MSKKVIVFDLDDTLILEKDYIKSGFKVIANVLENKLEKKSEEIFKNMMELFKIESDMLFNRLLDSYNVQYSKEEVLELVDIYRNHKPEIELLPDAREILEYLHSSGYRMGIITDGYAITQRRKLEALGIEKYFEHIIVTDELGREYWKPSEVPYKLIKEKMKVEYSEMVYIGDNPNKDFYISKILPIKTIRIIRERGIYHSQTYLENCKENIKIDDLRELKLLLSTKNNNISNL